MAEKPSPDKFKSNSAMMAGFAAIWLTVGANEASHFLVPDDEGVSTFGYEIEVPEGFGSGGGAAAEVFKVVADDGEQQAAVGTGNYAGDSLGPVAAGVKLKARDHQVVGAVLIEISYGV